jgi:thiol-disulfide isomerase/thioredoxin
MNSASLRFLGAALMVLVGFWAGSRLYLSRAAHDHRSVAVSAGEASAPDPKDLAPSDADVPHPVIPTRLPLFTLGDLKGQPTPIAGWSGKSLVINFWATWCAPCQREIPLLKTLASEWAGRGVAVLGIAVDYRDKVQEFAGRLKIDYPLFVGEQDALDVAASFGMGSPAFPFTVFTDRDGEVVALFVGELHRPQADLILSVVQDLNAQRMQLKDARKMITEGLGKLAEKS